MRKKLTSSADKAGLVPGTPVLVGRQKAERTSVSVTDYDAQGHFLERRSAEISELMPITMGPTVTWVDVVGLHEIDQIEAIGSAFSIHPLLLEDILNTTQRTKMEEYEDYVYLILKSLSWEDKLIVDQVSIVLGKTFVLTFQERENPEITELHERVRQDQGRLRSMGADFLAHAVLDSIVDRYFVSLEKIREKIELLEVALTGEPTDDALTKLHALRREIISIRRILWPLLDILNSLQRGKSDLFAEPTRFYLSDVYDHAVRALDALEAYRDVTTGLIELYLSLMSQKTNEVMKVLTIIATIFIPITFITSLYGMNFRNMPELNWSWSYPLIWATILIISGLMLWYFRRNRWL